MAGVVIPKPEAGPVSLYYWDGSVWQKWLGNPTSLAAQLYYWDGAAWQKWTGAPTTIGSYTYYWDGAAWQKWLGNPTAIGSQGYVWDGAAWQKMAGTSGGFLKTTPASIHYVQATGATAPIIRNAATYLFWVNFYAYTAGFQYLYLRNGNLITSPVIGVITVNGPGSVLVPFSPPFYLSLGMYLDTGAAIYTLTASYY